MEVKDGRLMGVNDGPFDTPTYPPALSAPVRVRKFRISVLRPGIDSSAAGKGVLAEASLGNSEVL
jgi:hypothetical protein